jgi:hypothetical protein
MTSSAGQTRVLEFHREAAKKDAVETLEHAGFVADIFHSPHLTPAVWHLIFTRVGSPEVIHWKQEPSLAEAVRTARALLQTIAVERAG